MPNSTDKNRKSKADNRSRSIVSRKTVISRSVPNITKRCDGLLDRLQSTRLKVGAGGMTAADEHEPPEKRLPARFRTICRLGVEIIHSIGRPVELKLVACPWVATVYPYHISYFTQFNPPAGRGRVGWKDGELEQFKLVISERDLLCLDVVWTPCNKTFLGTRDPKGNDWDRHLRKLWDNYTRRAEAARRNR